MESGEKAVAAEGWGGGAVQEGFDLVDSGSVLVRSLVYK